MPAATVSEITAPHPPLPGQGRFAGKVALVTGASRGIGAAIALALGAEGAQTVLVARTVGGLEETDDAIRAAGGPDAALMPLDLRETAKIGEAAAVLFERYGRLDILVSAAGVPGPLSPIAHSESAKVEEAMAVNAMAAYWLMRMVDPLLRRAQAGRALFITAPEAAVPPAYAAAYAASKAALEAFVRSWAAELGPTAVRAVLLDPGAVGTKLRRAFTPGLPNEGFRTPAEVAAAALPLLLPDFTEQAARITLAR